MGSPGAFVFDPDPALIRAHALGAAAEALSAGLLTPEDHYLTGDHLSEGPWRRAASAYRITEVLPYKPKLLAERLRARSVGRLVVKKRFFPLEPEALSRTLGLSGQGAETTLILSKESRHGFLAVLCEPVS